MTQDIGTQIIEKAKSLGASLAGITSVELVKKSPSYELHEKSLKDIDGIGSSLGITKIIKGEDRGGTFLGINEINEIVWPENAKSVLVIALHHPHDKPELDWFLESRYLPGNEILYEINKKLSAWIKDKYGIKTHHVNYWIGGGGMYLKDTAVLSGLGCIGKNNLVVTPEFGPRVRFRALLLDHELTPTGPIDFDPCDGCEEFCHKVCGQNAFHEKVFSPDETGMSNLPGRNGNFSRIECSKRPSHQESGIAVDDPIGFYSDKGLNSRGEMGTYQTQKYIMFCIRCIESCPVGA